MKAMVLNFEQAALFGTRWRKHTALIGGSKPEYCWHRLFYPNVVRMGNPLEFGCPHPEQHLQNEQRRSVMSELTEPDMNGLLLVVFSPFIERLTNSILYRTRL